MKNYNQDVKFILYENLKLEFAKTNDDIDNFSCDVFHFCTFHQLLGILPPETVIRGNSIKVS